jgi:HSP20 family protein
METLRRLPQTQSWPMLLTNLFNRDMFNEGNLNFFDHSNPAMPAVNIKETPEAFAIEVAAPGMSREDFKIELDNNELTLSAEKNEQSADGTESYHRREFSFRSFRRTFTLPADVVNLDKINARYTDGILSLTIPKKEEALPKPARLIEIA